MFTYFKKKEQEQTQHKKPNPIAQQNNKAAKSNQSDQSIKLPSDIFAQLLNQSSSSQQKVQINPISQDLNLRKLSEGDEWRKLSQEVVETGQNQNNISKNDKQVEVELKLQKAQQEQLRAQNIKSQKDSPKQSSTHQIALPILTNNLASKQLSSLSQNELNDLFTMFLDLLTKSVESQLIGQPFSMQSLATNILPSTIQMIQKLNSSFYENFLLQTKEKYNQLVDQSTNLFLKSRQIANLVNEFVLSINLFFQSEELLIPAQEIHKAIAELNPQKTEKYINYLIKIFESNFDDVIQKRVKQMKTSLENQLRKSQKQVKQLQNELKKVLNQFKQKQGIFTEQENKFFQKQSLIQSLKRQISDLNIKLTNISSSSKETQEDYSSQLSLLKRQLERSKKQNEELTEKNKKLQKLVQKKQKLLAQKAQQVEKLGEVIRKVKQVENEGMQSIVQEMEMKEKMFQSKIEKFNSEKILLQHKIRTLMADNQSYQTKIKAMELQSTQLKEQVQKLNCEISRLNQTDSTNKQVNENHSQAQHDKEQQQEQQKMDVSNLVNKEIFKHLFLSFDDQSKQWAVRNNIRNQIYIMLDVKKGSNNQPDQQTKPAKIKIPPNEEHNNTNDPAKKQTKKSTEGSLIGKWLGW